MLPEIIITSTPNAELFLMENVGIWPVFDSVISIGNIGMSAPKGYIYVPHRLRFEFDDIEIPVDGLIEPTINDIAKLIEFSNHIKNRKDKRVLIHCDNGFSSSASAGLILISILLGDGNEEDAIDIMESCCISEDISPSMLIIELADEILGREEKLIDAMIGRFNKASQSTLGGCL